MAISNFDSGKMGLPDDFWISRFLELFRQKGQGPVPAPGINAYHLDPLLGEVKRALSGHAGTLD